VQSVQAPARADLEWEAEAVWVLELELVQELEPVPGLAMGSELVLKEPESAPVRARAVGSWAWTEPRLPRREEVARCCHRGRMH
jgi:hypothetical protein